jgi:hypothetical protein
VSDDTELNPGTGGDLISTDEVSTLNGAASSGVKVQRVKQGFGEDGTYRDVSDTYPMPVKNTSAVSTSSAVTNISASASSVTLLSSNANRKGARFYNHSSATAYLKEGTTASGTSFTVLIEAGGFYNMPVPVYTGQIDCIWDSATGAMRITELS